MAKHDYWKLCELTAAFGLKQPHIKYAIKIGLLRPGIEFIPRKSERDSHLYNVELIKPLVSEIKGAHARRFKKNKHDIRRETLLSQPSKYVDSNKKRELLSVINQLTIEEHALLEQWVDIRDHMEAAEAEYWQWLWARNDCPYCRGSGRLKDDDCLYCLPAS